MTTHMYLAMQEKIHVHVYDKIRTRERFHRMVRMRGFFLNYLNLISDLISSINAYKMMNTKINLFIHIVYYIFFYFK